MWFYVWFWTDGGGQWEPGDWTPPAYDSRSRTYSDLGPFIRSRSGGRSGWWYAQPQDGGAAREGRFEADGSVHEQVTRW